MLMHCFLLRTHTTSERHTTRGSGDMLIRTWSVSHNKNVITKLTSKLKNYIVFLDPISME